MHATARRELGDEVKKTIEQLRGQISSDLRNADIQATALITRIEKAQSTHISWPLIAAGVLIGALLLLLGFVLRSLF